MSKIILLSLIFSATFLSSCGFHTPRSGTSLNLSVISAKNNAFANELKKHFNPSAAKSLRVEISNETQKKQAASFDKTGQITSYNLSLSVLVKAFKGKKVLLSENFAQTVHLQRVLETQSDRLRITEHYNELRETLIKRLLRKLKRL
ncbi:MAG: hypothetical protein HAW58_01225 [Candidatus Thioglobus sp.]|nr:hypothetical protein [Candidatus Thioglobus sp.]